MVKPLALLFAFAAALSCAEADFKPGKGEFELKTYGRRAYKSKSVMIDTGKAYWLTGTYRTAGEPTEISLGMELYDADGDQIYPFMFTAFPGSETELAAPLAKGDSEIKVKDAAKWRLDSGKFAVPVIDFKARKIRPGDLALEVRKIVREKGVWVLKLAKPAPLALTAGTKLRRHAGRAPFNAVWRGMIDGKKRTFGKLILPGEKYDPASHHFYPGTRSGRIFTIAPKGVTVYFSNLKCVPVAGAELEKLKRGGGKGDYLALFPMGKIKPLFAPGGRQVWHAKPHGGFQSGDCRIPQDKVRQIEALVSADRPGMMGCFFHIAQDGEEFVHYRGVPMRSDGKPRWMIVRPDHKTRRGMLTYLDFGWRNSDGADLSVERVRVLDQVNLIPGADDVPRGFPVAVDYILDQGKPHRLSWSGGANPGLKIEWFDAAGQVFAATELAAGRKSVDFILPERAVRGELRVAPGGSGEPALRPLATEAETHGEWIWMHHGSGPEHTDVWFERDFVLPGAPVDDAAITVAADDHSWVYLNGKYVGAGGSHIRAGRLDVKEFLKPGAKNVLAVRTRNDTGFGALLCDLRIVQNGRECFVSSNPEWRCAVGGETPPTRIDGPTVSVDTERRFRYSRHNRRYLGPRPKLSIVERGENFFTAKVDGALPPLPDALQYSLRNTAGNGEAEPLALATKVTKQGELYRFDCARPFLCRRGDFELALDEDRLQVVGDRVVGRFSSRPRATGLIPAAYSFEGGRPKLRFGGREYAPFFWKFPGQFPRSFPAKADQIAAAVRGGYRSFALSTDFVKCWPERGRFDFSNLDAQVEQLLSVCPDAVFMIQMGCFMPDWWLAENPDDTSAREDGAPRDKHYERQSLSSRKWLADARIPLKAFIEHVKNSPYGDRVWGVNVAENVNWEWFWWNGSRYKGEKPFFSGFSKADLAAFRMHLKRKYRDDAALARAWNDPAVTLDTARMPSEKEILGSSAGSLLDVARNRKVIDWFEYRNASLGHAFITLCKFVKEFSDGKLLAGGYYAYAVGLASGSGHPIHDVGHNAFLEAAESPYVNFFRAPAGYASRRLGMAGSISVPWATMRMRNKVVFVECDMRTPLKDNRGYSDIPVARTATIDQSFDLMNRFFGKMAATGNSYYWYDITDGGFVNPALESQLKRQMELYNALPPVQNLTPREIAAVGDRDTIYYTRRNNSKDTLMEAAVRCAVRTLPKLGAPYDLCCTADLVSGKLPPKKFYVMYNAYMLSKEYREALLRRFEAEKASVLWLYCVGASYPDRGPKAEFCADFLGVKVRMDASKRRPKLRLEPAWGGGEAVSMFASSPWFLPESGFDEVLGRDENGAPALVRVTRGGATHYLSTLPDLPAPVVRRLAEKSGVHFYTPDTNDPAWIGNDLVFLHCATSGSKALTLRPGTVLKQILGPDVRKTLRSGEAWFGEAGRTYGFQVVAR